MYFLNTILINKTQYKTAANKYGKGFIHMFIGREKELHTLQTQFTGSGKCVVLLYGKRRIGKSTLIDEAAKGFDGVFIHHLCVQSTYAGNLSLLCRSVCQALGLPMITFSTIFDLFDFLQKQDKNILLVLDEYQYWKNSGKKNELDSYLQSVIDRLPSNIRLVLCGSYITVMKELLLEGNPLFGRFTTILHLREFDYYDSSRFYPDADIRTKIAYYAIFGGSPYVVSCIDLKSSLADNIQQLILPDTGILRSYIENVLLKEINQAYDVRIFSVIGNGKKKYSEIRNSLGGEDTGLLDKQLKALLNMETIAKVSPINRQNDRKKQFYTINDNLMRFYFTFVFGNDALIGRLGESIFYRQYIQTALAEFISRRLEGLVNQYFKRCTQTGKITGVLDYGSYWYDDPITKKNGEFDCVLKTEHGYDFYECKYYKDPMTYGECEQEAEQLRKIEGIACRKIGFVCTGGFNFTSEEYILIEGSELYNNALEKTIS